jgi:hypothetical protein
MTRRRVWVSWCTFGGKHARTAKFNPIRLLPWQHRLTHCLHSRSVARLHLTVSEPRAQSQLLEVKVSVVAGMAQARTTGNRIGRPALEGFQPTAELIGRGRGNRDDVFPAAAENNRV